MKYAQKSLVEKPEGKILPGKPWHSLYNNIKMDLKDVEY
jgi:hypothetical protein